MALRPDGLPEIEQPSGGLGMGPKNVPNMGGIRTSTVSPVQPARQPAVRSARPGPRPTPRPMNPNPTPTLPPPAPGFDPSVRIPVIGRADPRAGAYFNKLVPRAQAHPNRPMSQAIMSAYPGGAPRLPDPAPPVPPSPVDPPIQQTRPRPFDPVPKPEPGPIAPVNLGVTEGGGAVPSTSAAPALGGIPQAPTPASTAAASPSLGGGLTGGPGQPSPGAPQQPVSTDLRDGYPDSSLVGGSGAHGLAQPAPPVPPSRAGGGAPGQPQAPAYATKEQIGALAPGASAEIEHGTVYHDPQSGKKMLRLNPAAKIRYQEARQQLAAKFKHFTTNPAAPQPNLVPGGQNFDPFSGTWLD